MDFCAESLLWGIKLNVYIFIIYSSYLILLFSSIKHCRFSIWWLYIPQWYIFVLSPHSESEQVVLIKDIRRHRILQLFSSESLMPSTYFCDTPTGGKQWYRITSKKKKGKREEITSRIVRLKSFKICSTMAW